MITDSTISGSLNPKTEPRTHAERLLWLAEIEIDCPEHIRGGFCRHCKETTGKVPHFPTLRRECPRRPSGRTCWHRDDNGEFKHPDGTRWTRKGCPNCQGRGWVPADSLEAMLPCAYEWRFEVRGEEKIIAYCRLIPTSLESSALGGTYSEAASLALYRAGGGEAMTKQWAGSTPFSDPFPGSGRTSYQQSQADKALGFMAAMNSPIVTTLVEELREMKNQFSNDLLVGWRKLMMEAVEAALAAYDAGLKLEEKP